MNLLAQAEPVIDSGDGGVFLVMVAVVWIACMCLGVYVAIQKGRSTGEGATLALFFGPFGVLIAALLPTIEGSMPKTRVDIENSTAKLPLPKNPTEDDYRDLIDWNGVVTEEDEGKAKRAAYLKYLDLFGPRLEVLSWTKEGGARCQRVCGNPVQVPVGRVGKAIVCPTCKTHVMAPSAI